MCFVVRSSPRAESDTQRIYDWIRERSAQGAKRWWLAFEEACKRLSAQPNNFGLAPEAFQAGYDVRQILFQTIHGHPYRALYVIIEGEVRILRVRGPGQPILQDDELL